MAKDLFNRYIWLVDTIYRNGNLTLKEISDKWEKSELSTGNPLPERTFHNHRKEIEKLFDINIVCNKGTYEYYIENAEDIEQGGVRSWLLNTFAVNNLINESHKLKHRIQFEYIPSGQKYLTPVIEAMRDGLKLEVTYHSYWSEAATFEIEPYFVKVFKQRWYLIGKSDHIRIYALDRFEEMNITDQTFKMPDDIDSELYFYNCYGVIQNEEISAKYIKLQVSATQAKYFRALPLHHSQRELEVNDEYVIFEYYIKPTYDFIQEILSHGEKVKVISPVDFRNEIKEISQAVSALYADED